MLESVLDVLLRHLDLQAHAAFGQLLDLRPHCGPLCQNDVGLPGVARVELTVSPGAARSELVGRHGRGWRARVAARPSAAAQTARSSSCSPRCLASPATGSPSSRVVERRKLVEVDGLTADEIDRRLDAAS